MSDWAPDFYHNVPYPSGGEKIGPAWRLVWQRLEGGNPLERRQLCDRVAMEASVSPRTVENLIRKAVAVGLLVVTKRTPGNPAKGGQRPYVARADHWYATHPELAPEGYQPPVTPVQLEG